MVRRRAGRPRKMAARYPSGKIKQQKLAKPIKKETIMTLLEFLLKAGRIDQNAFEAGMKLFLLRKSVFGSEYARTFSYSKKHSLQNKRASNHYYSIRFLNEKTYNEVSTRQYLGAIRYCKKYSPKTFRILEKYVFLEAYEAKLRYLLNLLEKNKDIHYIILHLELLYEYFRRQAHGKRTTSRTEQRSQNMSE